MGIFSFRNKNEKEAEEKKYRFGMEGMLREVLDKNSKGQESLDTLSKEIRQIGTDVRKHDMALEDCLDVLEEQREEETQSQKKIAELESGQEKLLQVLDAYQEQVWNMMRYAAEHDPAWVAQIDLIRNAVRGKQISGGISLIEETGVRVDYALHEVIEIIDTAEEERAQVIVLTIFNIRERKYEIGVLTAIGVKKAKVAAYRYVQTDGQEQGTSLERGL